MVADPFESFIKGKDAEKKKPFKDALLFAHSEVSTESGRKFIKSCQKFFDKTGFLTKRQIDALYRIDSEPRSCGNGDEEIENEEGYYDYDRDHFNDYGGLGDF